MPNGPNGFETVDCLIRPLTAPSSRCAYRWTRRRTLSMRKPRALP